MGLIRGGGRTRTRGDDEKTRTRVILRNARGESANENKSAIRKGDLTRGRKLKESQIKITRSNTKMLCDGEDHDFQALNKYCFSSCVCKAAQRKINEIKKKESIRKLICGD